MTTQFANASYQEIIDLHTESDSVSVIGVHTPCSDTPYHMLRGFWDQFKKFKYNGCSISLVPTAQLPVDPLQVSYDASEPTIDPRDMLNPILFHGCHGDDMGAILNSLYSDPVSGASQLITTEQSDSIDHNQFAQNTSVMPVTDMFEELYYRALTDKTWLKAHPQRGFRKSGLHPMLYQLASTVQYGINAGDITNVYSTGITHNTSTGATSVDGHGSFGNLSNSNNAAVYSTGGFGRPEFQSPTTGAYQWSTSVNRSMSSIVTPGLRRLGWMDTRSVVGHSSDAQTNAIGTPLTSTSMEISLADMYRAMNNRSKPVLTPKIFMGMIMLPPAYKVKQHFRLVLNHSFSFARFRGASMQYNDNGMLRSAYSVFNFSDSEASKKIDPPEPEPEPKDGDFVGDDGSKADF